MKVPDAGAVLHAVAAAVVCVDAAGVVCRWNVGAERLFGIAAAEAVGASFHGLVAAAPMRDAGPDAASEPPAVGTFQMTCRRCDGREVTVEGTAALLADTGEPTRVLLLRELPAAAGPARGILAPAAAARLHHDVANPLNAVLGFAYLLRAGEGGELPALAREMVEDLAEAAREVKRLLEAALSATPKERAS